MYVGKKSFHTMRKKQKRESQWRTYFGSSTILTETILTLGSGHFKFEILRLVPGSDTELSYYELKEMFSRDVLFAKLPNGHRAYYNLAIQGSHFRYGNIRIERTP